MKTSRLRIPQSIAALALALCGGCVFHGEAGTIVAAPASSGSSEPFGFGKSSIPTYLGQYQQIYPKALFPTALKITQIAFGENQGLGDADVSYTLSIGFGVTARTPAAPGTGFATGAVPVFNGTALGHITANTKDFDFTITLDTPFLYDPALGNLLLDITMISATKSPTGNTYGYFAAAIDSGDVATLTDSGFGIVAAPFHGLTTRFTTAPVPEPATAGLLLVGAAVALRRCGRSVAVAPKSAMTGPR